MTVKQIFDWFGVNKLFNVVDRVLIDWLGDGPNQVTDVGTF